MIDREHDLSLTRQAEALAISRGSVYYQPQPLSQATLALMRLIDKLHLDHPCAGARMLRDLLRLRGIKVGRRRVGRLMQKMGIEALYRKPNTSRKHPENPVYPYLLRHLKVERPNQVWAMDITYIPMAQGFIYLAAVIDWYSRKVLSWRVSITLDVQFCLDAVIDAIDKYGTPEIFNTDQGSQFSSDAFTGALKDHNIRITMDGKGSWRDNVFVKRLWRSVKYEEVYLKAYETVTEARRSIGIYLNFYNTVRPHSSLDGIPTDQFYCNNLLPLPLAA